MDRTALVVTVVVLALSGVFRSTGFTTYNTPAFADVPAERMTGANSLMSTVQELGAGLGVALGALLVRVGGVFTDGVVGSYRIAFVALAVLLVVPAVEAVRLPGSAGNDMVGRAK